MQSAARIRTPTNLLHSAHHHLHFYYFFPTFLLDSSYNLTRLPLRSYIFTTFSNPAPFSIPFPPSSHSSIPVPNNQNRPPRPLSPTSSRPYIFTSPISPSLHSYYISHLPLQSCYQHSCQDRFRFPPDRLPYLVDYGYIYTYNQNLAMRLDSEQKRVLKAALPAFGGFLVGYPFLSWILGKLDSWKDLLIYLGIGIVLSLLTTCFYVLGSKIPKKDE